MNKSRALIGAAVCAVMLGAAGCSKSYYRVRDTANVGNTYYTRSLDTKRSGTVVFTDARSGARVTLQSSTIQRISREEWNGAVEE